MPGKEQQREMEQEIFAERIVRVPRSFIREILKVSLDPEIISFAGGLPNRDLFPVSAMEAASSRAFELHGRDMLQYSSSEGLLPLRQYIADRYLQRKGLRISPEDILITNGSQQGLDLLGKALINVGDGVVIEEPGYLGAIQSLSICRPRFLPVTLTDHGLDIAELTDATYGRGVKMMYCVPSFQNPSGITYTEANRRQVAEVADARGFFVVEDDPYGELRFSGSNQPSFATMIPERTILLGSFSKIVAPGLRIGWIVAPEAIREKLLVAKQASDLNTSGFTQQILCQYLLDNDLDAHIAGIAEAYGRQCRAMVDSIGRHLPDTITWTRPEGGMFLWGRLPSGLSAMKLFEYAAREKVVFVPGDPFYTTSTDVPALRLNFTCANEQTIEEGVVRFRRALRQVM
jgi:2-aminoadipate transaminase